jgi:hypothetical protein
MIHYPARWAGLGKLLGLRPEIPEESQLQNCHALEEILKTIGTPRLSNFRLATVATAGDFHYVQRRS